MATTINLNAETLAQIRSLKHFGSEEEAVNEALNSYLRQLRQQQALPLKGAKIWDGNLDEMRRD